MPAYVAHHIFATTVQRVTGESAARMAALYPAAYRWGAQGPDPLYYYHMPFAGPVGRLAARMHSSPPDVLFEALCAAAVKQRDTAALAYVFGFCTHYALDRVVHAFTVAQAERLRETFPTYSAAARYHLVESDIDGVLIAAYISGEAAFEAYRLLDPNAAECTVLARVLSKAAQQALGARLSPSTVYRALHDMRRTQRLAHSGAPVKRHVQRVERLVGKAGLASSMLRPIEPLAADCVNAAHLPWESENGTRTDSFTDLFDAAVPLAVSLQRAVLERYYQQKPLDPRFFPTDFYGRK